MPSQGAKLHEHNPKATRRPATTDEYRRKHYRQMLRDYDKVCRENARLRNQSKVADELIQRLEDHLHMAEAIGDFSLELRDRRALQDGLDAYMEECRRIKEENARLREKVAELEDRT